MKNKKKMKKVKNMLTKLSLKNGMNVFTSLKNKRPKLNSCYYDGPYTYDWHRTDLLIKKDIEIEQNKN